MSTNDSVYEQAKFLYKQGKAAIALELLESDSAGETADAKTLQLMGISLHSLGAYKDALNKFQMAATQGELAASSQLALADSYFFTGAHGTAKRLYRALEASSGNLSVKLLSGLAQGLGLVNDFTGAQRVCERASLLNPSCHHAKYGVAYYGSKCGESPESIYPILQEVIEMAPWEFSYRVALATIYCRMNDTDRAYLTIADATPEELRTISCRCCIERLIQLYRATGDGVRLCICIRLLEIASTDLSN